MTVPKPRGESSQPVRRALIMAGGGLKVAYQAGVLQVWLDEAGIEFDLADGASGGTLNLAMWCQGMTGSQIADNWRAYQPLLAGTPNLKGLLHGPWSPSLLSFAGLRRLALPKFGLDWHAIRSTDREATFNLFNVTKQEHEVRPAAEMDEDLLLSAIALPMWFPPVRSGGDTYIDAVFACDANLEEAIRRGATELWVVWSVSTRGNTSPGFVGSYFTIIDAVANSRLKAVLDRIERSNAAIDAGKPGEFGRKIAVHLLSAEVPLHYLLNFRRSSFERAVELGIRDARAWCARRGIPTALPVPEPVPVTTSSVDSVSFHEVMSGTVRLDRPPAGQPAQLALEMDIVVKDTARFVRDPDHVASVFGSVRCAALGGELPIREGTFNVLVDTSLQANVPTGTPPTKLMVYDLRVTDAAGRDLEIHGVKTIRHDTGFDMWPDTTRLVTEIRTVGGAGDGRVVAAGVLKLSMAAFLRQLATFRATAGSPAEQAAALGRFGGFFLGHLWEVYRKRYRSTGGPVPLPRWLRKVSR